MGRIKLWVLVALVLVVTLSLCPLAQIHAESSSPPVDVLVTYYQQPLTDAAGLIESLGGTVRTAYHIVPTILASMPSDKIDELKNDHSVKSVEEDTKFKAYFAGQVLPRGVDRVDAELVHPTNKGTGIKIAVLDTGIDLDHPDLSATGNVTFVPGTVNGDDDNGHGTMVAGIIAALDNDIVVIGVAPEAALYSVKVLDNNGDGAMSWILSGIQWAVDNGMKVINMSFSGSMEMPTTVIDALNNAYNAGIVNVAGAGNGGNPSGEGNNVWAPARYSSVIAVGATDEQDARYSASSTGYQLELMAPGTNIYTTAMGGGYGYLTGTSASSPHAAGVAALLIHAGVTSNIEVRNRMRNSATDMGATGWDSQYGCGLVNAVSAINFSEPPDQTPPTTTISCNGTLGNHGWYISNVTVTLSAADNPGGSGVAQTKYSLDGGTVWNTYTSPFTISAEGYIVVLARSWDNAGNDEGPPAFVNIKIDKTPPTVTESAVPTQMKRIKKGVMVNVNYSGTASDALSGVDAPSSTVQIDEYGVHNRDLGAAYSGITQVEAWCRNNDADGRHYTIRFTVHDAAGNYALADAIITVKATSATGKTNLNNQKQK